MNPRMSRVIRTKIEDADYWGETIWSRVTS